MLSAEPCRERETGVAQEEKCERENTRARREGETEKKTYVEAKAKVKRAGQKNEARNQSNPPCNPAPDVARNREKPGNNTGLPCVEAGPPSWETFMLSCSRNESGQPGAALSKGRRAAGRGTLILSLYNCCCRLSPVVTEMGPPRG